MKEDPGCQMEGPIGSDCWQGLGTVLMHDFHALDLLYICMYICSHLERQSRILFKN